MQAPLRGLPGVEWRAWIPARAGMTKGSSRTAFFTAPESLRAKGSRSLHLLASEL